MKILMLVAMVGAIGCGSLEVDQSKVVPPPEHAEEAIHAVYDLYGLRSMPAIYWYGGAALNCGGGLSYIDQDGRCLGGDELGNVIIVAAPTGMLISDLRDTFGFAMLAHEMAHAASEQSGGDGCDDHRCHWFAPGGEAAQATDMLVAMGI